MSPIKKNVDGIRACWGVAAPDWILVLAEACDRASQSEVAKRLNVSGAMVSQALKNSYKGRLDRLEERVRGEFMNERVTCPVMGDISTRQCMDNQTRPYENTNHMRVALHRACRSCPNNRGKKEPS